MVIEDKLEKHVNEGPRDIVFALQGVLQQASLSTCSACLKSYDTHPSLCLLLNDLIVCSEGRRYNT